MILETKISWGYADLIKTFFEANELVVTCEERTGHNIDQINLHIEDDSDTAMSLTLMGYRHLGIENMLCDYLIRCGIPAGKISIGRTEIKRDMAELEKQWDEHRKTIGLR